MSDHLAGPPSPFSAAFHFIMKAMGWPPAVAIFATILGWTLQDWTYVVAIIAGSINAAYALWKWWREWRRS